MSLTEKDKEEIASMIAEAIDQSKSLSPEEELEKQIGEWEDNPIELDCGIVLAPKDLEIGGRKFFTWDEALELLEDEDWGMPTPAEWLQICAELGTDERGVFSAEILKKKTGMDLSGYVLSDDMDDYRKDPIDGGALYNQGTHGDFWSATAKDGTSAYDLDFNSSGLNPQDTDSKGYGFTVRCVAR